jgi:polysaccharide deacetylase family protein (PEP-CTERM system associated)
MRNILTVDVEDYFHVEAFAGVIPPESWSTFPSRVQRNTVRLLEILSARNAQATFFVLGWVAERFPALIRQIRDAGHEVACHGYAHRRVGALQPDGFRMDVRRAKNVLEDVTGGKVTSYRAPSYSVTSETLWALETLKEEGFENDSSIFPIHHDLYGIPAAPRFPYVRRLRNGSFINELPPSTIRFCRINLPVAGGGYLRLLPYHVTAWAIRRINETERQPAMLYVHPWEIDPEQPKIATRWRSSFRHYQNLDTTEDKLDRLLNAFAWQPVKTAVSEYIASKVHLAEVNHA